VWSNDPRAKWRERDAEGSSCERKGKGSKSDDSATSSPETKHISPGGRKKAKETWRIYIARIIIRNGQGGWFGFSGA